MKAAVATAAVSGYGSSMAQAAVSRVNAVGVCVFGRSNPPPKPSNGYRKNSAMLSAHSIELRLIDNTKSHLKLRFKFCVIIDNSNSNNSNNSTNNNRH